MHAQIDLWFDPINNGTNKEARKVNHLIEETLKGTGIRKLDVTRLSELRADAHPAVWLGKKDAVAVWGQDCMHWCLPGVPDTWVDILMQLIGYNLETGGWFDAWVECHITSSRLLVSHCRWILWCDTISWRRVPCDEWERMMEAFSHFSFNGGLLLVKISKLQKLWQLLLGLYLLISCCFIFQFLTFLLSFTNAIPTDIVRNSSKCYTNYFRVKLNLFTFILG